MANKKAEILTMDGQVVSPITLATNVLLDDGRTAQDLLDSRDESMFSPTITTSSSISKVGQGDNVDFSENIIDGAYKSCVLKGKTLVNHNAEGNNRNEYACMPSLEGSNLTVNGTVESKVKSAILKGQTLVNLVPEKIIDYTASSDWDGFNALVQNSSTQEGSWRALQDLKPNTKYFVSCYVETFNASEGQIYRLNNPTNTTTAFKEILEVKAIGLHKWVLTSRTEFTEEISIALRCQNYNTRGAIKIRDIMIIEYQEGMENWDIPYFTGMQSVKLPVLKTTRKNLVKDNRYTLDCGSGVALNGYRNTVIAKNIKVKPNTKYVFSYGKTVNIPSGTRLKVMTLTDVVNEDVHVDVYTHKNRIKEHSLLNGEMFTTESNARYISITTGNFTTTGDILIEDIQLEQGSTATSYEPYKSNILTVNEDVTLRGIGDVQDTLDCLTGEVTERIGEIVLDGSEDEAWTKNSSLSNDSYSTSLFTLNVKGIKRELNNGLSKKCDKFPVNPDYSHANDNEGIHQIVDNQLSIRVLKTKLTEDSVEGFRSWLSNNPLTVQYKLTTESVKTVDLSDNVVHSYKDTTHYTCSSEGGSLIPTLAIEEGVKYKAIIKPSTKYSIVFNRTEVASGLTVDLGGATTSVTSSTLGKNIVQITTPSTLSHNYVIFKGLGNVIKDVQVIEGDVVGDEPYFEGMCDVEMPVVKNVGKNLFDGKIEKSSIDVTTGSITPNVASSWSATNYINVKNINSLYFQTSQLSNMNVVYMCFDENKNFIGYKGFYNSLTGIITPLNNTHYIRLRLPSDIDVSTTQIEQGTQATSYEPYKSNTVTTNEVVLRSLPNGVSDTLNVETGEYVQRIGEVVLDNSDSAHIWNLNSDWSMGDVAVFWSNNVVKMTGNSILCDKFPSLHRNELIINNVAIKEAIRYGVTSVQFFIRKSRLETPDVAGFKRWLSQNPVTVQYELATPITTTIDLKQHPFAYKDGYIVLTSSSEEVSLTPTIEYSLIANRLGQIQSNQKLVEKQQAQIDELESMVITNLVNTQYQQALNEIKLGVK